GAEAISRSEPLDDNMRGIVVMTSSISAFEGQIGQAAYAASKGGVASLTLPLAREFGQHGIRVVSIAPGVFETPMMQGAPDKVCRVNPIVHRTISANGLRFHIAEAGSGHPVILLHGFPEFWYSWRHQLHALAKAGFRAIAPDLRGFNESDRPTRVSDYRVNEL